jgi:Subtilase family
MKIKAIVRLSLGLLQVAAHAQTNSNSFYWSRGNKIALQKVQNAVAAKVLERVDYSKKFPWLSKVFAPVGRSGLNDEPVLLKFAAASFATSLAALRSGIGSHEIYLLDVFQAGNAKLILQNEVLVRFKDGVTSEQAETLLGKFSGSFQRQPGIGLRYLIRVPDPSRTLAWADMLYRNHTVQSAEPNFLVVQPAGGWKMTVTASSPAPGAGGVPAPGFPNDLLFAKQWGLAKIGAQRAWAATHGSPAIQIAVIDDGVDVGHTDLKDKIAGSYDMLLDSATMNPPADDNHGTAVAGIAAASTNNAYGIAGLAPDVKLIPIRMFSAVAPASRAFTIQTITNSFEKAVELGADVINCSWDMPVPFDDVTQEIQAVASKGRHGKGAVIVFAAGNDGGPVAYPARLSASMPILAVGASNENDEFKTMASGDGDDSWASNYGQELTVVAPGIHLTTTAHRLAVPPGPLPFIDDFWGTSAAAPFVAGLASLVLSQHPDWTPEQVRKQIVDYSDKVVRTPDGGMIGRINACKTLGMEPCSPSGLSTAAAR